MLVLGSVAAQLVIIYIVLKNPKDACLTQGSTAALRESNNS